MTDPKPTPDFDALASDALRSVDKGVGYKHYHACVKANLIAAYELGTHRAALEAEAEAIRDEPVICTGCGSTWTTRRLAAERAANSQILSCCPERKMVPLKAAFEQAEAELAEAKRRVADAELCAEEQRAYSCELEGDVEQARALLKVATCGRAGSLEFLQFEAARMAWLRLIDSEREKEG